MVKGKQEETDPGAGEAVNEAQQMPEGMQLLKAVLDPINETLVQLNQGLLNMNRRLQALEEQPPPSSSLIPPEVAKVIPSLIQAVVGALTGPETPAEAQKLGVFSEEMMKSYTASIIKGWELDQTMKQAQLDRIILENRRIEKGLSDEF